jgi:hypothetical protein
LLSWFVIFFVILASSQVLYEVVLPHLNGGPVFDFSDIESSSTLSEKDVTSKEKKPQGKEPDDGYGVPQRSGTCAARSVLAVVKYLLKCFGMNRPERKLIFYCFRMVKSHAVHELLLNF